MLRHVGLVLISLSLSLSFTNAFARDQAPPYQNTPVERFYKVDSGLYRGATPDSLEKMKALKKLGIRTIINMQTDEKKIAWEAAAAKSLGMNHVSVPLPGFNAPKDADVKRIQDLMVQSSLKPIFYHCTHGRERTGIQTAIYRVFHQGWTPKKSYAEAKSFGFRSIVWPMKNYFEELTQTDL